jgi:hypothetical protein
LRKAEHAIAVLVSEASSDPMVFFSSEPRPEWTKLYMPHYDTIKVDMARRSLQDTLSRMESLGAVIVDPADFNIKAHIDSGFKALTSVYETEFKEGIAKYLDGSASTDVRNLQDIIE